MKATGASKLTEVNRQEYLYTSCRLVATIFFLDNAPTIPRRHNERVGVRYLWATSPTPSNRSPDATNRVRAPSVAPSIRSKAVSQLNLFAMYVEIF